MSNDFPYRVNLLPHYERTYEKLVKAHYRRNLKGKKQFDELLETIYTVLAYAPRENPPRAREVTTDIQKLEPEPWPANAQRGDWEFWKFYFRAPELEGLARFGRVMYLISEDHKVVQLFWIYTHAEYPKRPSDVEISRIIRSTT